MAVPLAIRRLLQQKQAVNLDLGCGTNKQADFIGIDARALPGVDIVHDLETFPWPLPASCAQTVIISHYFEHLSRERGMVFRFMAELHRVCRHGARVLISGPYGNGFRFMQDPSHTNWVVEATFCYFDPAHPLYAVYEPSPFKLASFERVPVGGDTDFNAVLIALKPQGQP